MSEKFGPPLNIDSYLGRSKNRINLVGVELEGGWNERPHGRIPDRDSSVQFNLVDDDLTKIALITQIGEIPLPPLSVKEFPATMKIYYPNYVNKTCGMHVHLSTLKAFSYQRLMVNKPYSYPATIVEYIKRWAVAEKLPTKHPIWERLAGKCEYCQHVFQAEEQAKAASKDFDHHRNGHRYTVVGYCWSRYKTLECRLLPMFTTYDQGVRAVQEVINITNAFLAASKDREPTRRVVIQDDEYGDIQERRTYV
jgi:hypothetical protein